MSTITDDTPAEVETYLAAMRATLSDLPPAERDDLLAEVESSLREAAGDTGSIGARLGSPEEFAAELRSAAGLHDSSVATTQPTIKETLERLAAEPRVAALRRLGAELAPVWWVLRGYLVVAGLAVVWGTSWSSRFPFVPRFGSAELGTYPLFPRFGGAEVGLGLIVLAVALSVRLGLKWRNEGSSSRRSIVALNLVCILLLLPVVAQLGKGAPGLTNVVVVQQPVVQSGLVNNGAPVLNIYPYSRDGKLLHDVLLYDSAGKAIDIGGNPNVPNPDRRVLRTSGNGLLYNAFPIRYYESGTVKVAHPNAGPPIKPPTILAAP
jgi:uncharacterized membrane protein